MAADFNEIHLNIEDVHFTVLTDYGVSLSGADAHKELNLSHFHSYYEVFFIQNGYLDITFETGKIQLKQNDFIVVPPRKTHYSAMKDTSDSRLCLSFSFEKNNLKSNYNLYSILLKIFSNEYLYIENAKHIHDTLNRLIECISVKNHLKASLCFHEFIIKLIDHSSQIMSEQIPETFSDSNMRRTYLLDNFISNHYAENVTIQLLANQLHLSTRQTNRIVQAYYGCTYREVIAKKRINAAVILLGKSDMSISEIAGVVGYNSLKGFYNSFKKHCDCLPAQYRKKL